MNYDDLMSTPNSIVGGEELIIIERLQAELSLYRKGFCEAHQPLPEDTYKGCYRCDLVHIHHKFEKLKKSFEISKQMNDVYLPVLEQAQTENKKLKDVLYTMKNNLQIAEQALNKCNNESDT